LNSGIKAHPFLVKPNEFELAQWRGKALHSESSVLRAAQALCDATGGWVLVSRGPKGALLAGQDKTIVCRAPAVRVRNTIGAGDALVAAVARQIQRESPPEEWLIHGVAAGTAATQFPAGDWPSAHQIRQYYRQVIATTK
jgi:fructose-1-phosphate kinase PfkB-like protein